MDVVTGEAIGYHGSAGYQLRCAREHSSLSLRDVARALNLLVTHVRAIEADRCDALAKDEQFVHRLETYASLVDLDAHEVVDNYRSRAATSEQNQAPLAEEKSRHKGIWLTIGTVALAAACWEIWLLNQPLLSADASDTVVLSQAKKDNKAPALRPRSEQQLALHSLTENAAAGAAEVRSAQAIPVPEQKDVAVAPVRSTSVTSPAKSQPQTTAGPSLRSNEWFASLVPDRYTVQILSFRKEQNSRAFIQNHNIEDEAAYFAVRKDDETWYAVTYGLYDSYEAAQSASKSLPSSIKHVNPWVRNTGRIQQSMMQLAQH
jgi:septal ring-binding cell division protein DamX